MSHAAANARPRSVMLLDRVEHCIFTGKQWRDRCHEAWQAASLLIYFAKVSSVAQ